MLCSGHLKTHEPGTCTACIALQRLGAPTVSIANLGDSGARLYRDGNCVARTKP